MKLSAWNQYWKHTEIVCCSPEKAYERLLRHYKQSAGSFTLYKEDPPNGFSFHRGNVLVSAFGLGSELWCKHYIDVDFQEVETGKTQIVWDINLKLFGLQAGKNAIIEECKDIIKKIE